jgi:ubiquinone/menaquinone biosynthesis C-methylase UbiE
MESEKTQDKWAQWLLHKRHGGDSEMQKTQLTFLERVRDKVLQNAKIVEGNIVLDIGTGDGLISFGAIDRVGRQGKVIFSDISEDLLDHCRSLAEELGMVDRCQFLKASADNLAGCDDVSIDVVTVRSVLIYVEAKQSAFKEFYRVLKPGGRLSIFEPINRFGYNPANCFMDYDVAPIIGIVGKISAIYSHLQPATDPMLDFDERDLFSMVEEAGFGEIHLELHADMAPVPAAKWETMLRMTGNPRIPTLEEAMKQALTVGEIEMFTKHLRPQVETGQGTRKSAAAYLWALKI